MSNFRFVQAAIEPLYEDCHRAESYLVSDPRSACFYARRAVEALVEHLYAVLALPAPYKNDLNARINGPQFKTVVGPAIGTKLNLIRRQGNTAVHQSQAVPGRIALALLTELHHVMVWAVFHHSPYPKAAPTQARFDPSLAAKAAPLGRAEVAQLAEKFAAQDAAHAKALTERDELAAAREAEIAALQARVAAAQAANQVPDGRDYAESQTRDLFIDLLLGEAGWPLADDRDREYAVTGMPEGKTGRVDYVLWGSDDRPLAVVEAKRASKSPHLGQQQAKLYADCLHAQYGRRPMIFYTNGYEHVLWDDAAGYPPRPVAGFRTRDELELMIARRGDRVPLSGATVNTAIVERPYQARAIAAVDATLDAKQRHALLVMATGAGKTRTVIALVDQLMRAGWVKRVLFLADRRSLVKQAVDAFKEHLPAVTTINLLDEKNPDARVYGSTYPTMLNLINKTDGGRRPFGPGYFDLVVVDEAHRSVYQRYGAIFDWFDALLVGLTATPKDEVDHNTYRLFRLEDGVPTDAYSLADAVDDGYLVPPRGVSVGTKFLRSGIRYADLTDVEKAQWDELDWGEGDTPTEVDAEALNRFLFNEDTVDKVLATVMADGYKVAGGDRLGKTIIFAKNQAHAEFIQQRFDAQYPYLAGTFARTITHGSSYAEHLVEEFKVPGAAPHIAISVDMLDTGIDVPSVVNLVFFKTVQSKSKFWQMIGRGTRRCPDIFGPGQDKADFLVFDFCGNLEFFSQDLPGSEGSLQKSLSQRLFETRLDLVVGLDAAGIDAALRASTTAALHEFVCGMTLDNVIVRPHRAWVQRYAEAAAWSTITTQDANDVRDHLAGLPSAAVDPNEEAKRFDLIVLRRQVAQLDGDTRSAEKARESITAVAVALLGKLSIPSVAQNRELLDDLTGKQWWVEVTLPMLEVVRVRLRGLVGLVETAKRLSVYTDFADELGEATSITLPGTTPGTNMARFRAKAAQFLRQHEDTIALQRLRRNKQLTAEDLDALQDMLLASGAGQQVDITFAAERSGGLGLFVRSLVGLDRAAAKEALGEFLNPGAFTVDQIRFVDLIVDELTANGVMEPSRLFESPYTDQAPTGPDLIFPPPQLQVLVEILNDVTAHAQPEHVA